MISSNIKKLSFCAMIVALSLVLSKIKIIPMPLGGSVTLFSMFAISLPGFLFGMKYGISSALIYSLFKLIFGGYVYTPVQAILDYILSYTAFSITSFSYNGKSIKGFIGTFMIAAMLRFVFSCISGYVFFAEYAPKAWNPLIYTIVYNAAYIFTEAFITVGLLLIPYINKLVMKLKDRLCR